MNYDDWERSMPTSITSDSLWKMRAYRLALFASRIGWHDVTRLMQELTMIPDQRGRTLREDDAEYLTDSEEFDEFEPTLIQLLSDVPLP